MKIKNFRAIFIYLLLFPLICPTGLYEIIFPKMREITNYWTYLTFFALFFMIFIKKITIEKGEVPFLVYIAYLILISFFHKVFDGYNVKLLSLASLSSVFLVFLVYKKDYKLILSILYWHYFVVNGISLVLSTLSGMFSGTLYIFIGHRQLASMNFSLVSALSFYYYYHHKHKFYLLPILFAIINIFCASTSTGLIALIIGAFFLVILTFIKKRKENKWYIRFINIMWTVLLFTNIVLVIFNNAIFSSLSAFLGEGADFNGRFSLWKSFLDGVAASPIIGYGFRALSVYQWSNSSNMLLKTMEYCHNTFIQELSSGGIIQLILFVVMVFSAINSLKEFKKKEYIIVLGTCFIIFFFIMIPESVMYFKYFSIFLMIVHAIEKIERDENRGLCHD